MLMAGIAIIFLVMGGVGTMYLVMQENAEVADEVIIVSNHVNERGQEDVEVTKDPTGIQLYNNGPDVRVLEYRVVDDGALVRSCPALLEVGSTQKETIGGTEPALKDCWDEYDDPDERFQIVTARGKIFTLEEPSGGNGTTTIINPTTIIQQVQNGSGVGFGYLPQIVIHQPPSETIIWGNSTHSDGASTGPYMRVGAVDYAGMVKPNDNSVSINMPSLSGEYSLSGNRLQGNNELYGYGSNWQDMGGWIELSGGPNAGEPHTSVVRLQDHYITNNLVNVTGYASENATVRIVSSPNDLTRLAVDGDGFAPEVLPIDSYLNYTKILFYGETNRNSRTIQQPITYDLFECIPGRSDTYTQRGFRCHSFAYPSFPAETYTDFYAKDCADAVETRRVGSVYILDDVDAGYTRGVYNSSGVNSEDFERWYPVALRTPPEIECGPKTDGYHHVTKIGQNQTTSYSGTYRFGPDDGVSSRGDLLQEIHGNVSLNTGDHDVHFEGTGLFEETIDFGRMSENVTEVFVTVDLVKRSNAYTELALHAPDGQTKTVCTICNDGTYTVTFDEPISYDGDWELYAEKTFTYPGGPSGERVVSWELQVGYTSVYEAIGRTPGSVSTLFGTITIPDIGPLTKWRGDLYLMATGMNNTGETVLIRATDQTSHSQLIIRNLPPHAPYMITDDGNVMQIGMASRHGVVEIPYGEITSVLTGPIVLEYWPDSTTYVGNAHANGNGMLFDPYNGAVVEFPWKPDDPLLYVARAYVKLTVPVDDTEFGGARLVNEHGQAARYPYLAGTYGAGDEIYVPIFPGAREIHLRINGDWIQSYIKDVQQNSQARVFGEVYATGIGLGDLAYYNAEATATATMFATQAGEAIAVISATSSGSADHYLRTSYGHGVSDTSDRWSNAKTFCIVERQDNAHDRSCRRTPAQSHACGGWRSYIGDKATEIAEFHSAVGRAVTSAASGGAVTVSVYHNGDLVQVVSGSDATSYVSSAVEGSFGNEYANDYCSVETVNVNGRFGRITSGSPWSSEHTISTEFRDATFTKPVVVSGVEPGDQIDFVINAGNKLGGIPDPLPHWSPSSVTSYSFSNVVLESGYILLYQ